MHITTQEKNPNWTAGEFRIISREVYQPNYCFDCNLSFFGSVCFYCNGKNVDVKGE
jgi:hypothetical protein